MSKEQWFKKSTLSRLVPLLNSTKSHEIITAMAGDGSFGVLKIVGINDYQIRQDRLVEFLKQVPALRSREARRLVLMCELPVDCLE